MDCPPAADIAAVEPVLVDTHIPDDQTFKECSTSYDTPANRVLAPSFGTDGIPELLSIFDNQPRRKRDTEAGLGLDINKSFNAGTRRVSEKVDLILQRIRVLLNNLSYNILNPKPKKHVCVCEK
jgi:hypothetical protein